MGRLSGHHVLVTGGSRGIGAATVQKALEEGANVTSFDIIAGPALGVNGLSCAADVTKAADIARAVAQAVVQFGPVTVVSAGKDYSTLEFCPNRLLYKGVHFRSTH